MAQSGTQNSRAASAGFAATFVIVTFGVAYVAIMKVVLESEKPVAPAARKRLNATPRTAYAAAEEPAPAQAEAAAPQPQVDEPVTILWPIRETRLSSGFGYRINPVTQHEQHHHGVDVPAPVGSHVLAIDDGEVVYSGYSATGGNMVKIDHGNGWTTVYLHLSRSAVQVGTRVTAGQLIAFSGATGAFVTGPHLHFEVWKGEHPIDPTAFRYRMPAGVVLASR